MWRLDNFADALGKSALLSWRTDSSDAIFGDAYRFGAG